MKSHLIRIIFVLLLFTGTTYVLKENGVEVGRMVDDNGKNDVQILESGTPSGESAPGSGMAVKNPRYPWFTGKRGYDAAMIKQKQTGDAVLLYFFTTWCPACQEFEKKALNTPAVEARLAPALRVRIDADKENVLAEQYEVNSYPRLYILAASGKKNKISASRNPESFLKSCRGAGLKVSEL